MQQPAWRTQPSEGQSSLSEGLSGPKRKEKCKKSPWRSEKEERGDSMHDPEMSLTDS